MSEPQDADGSPEPVEIFGEIEASARGCTYGAMLFEVEPGGTTTPETHASEELWIVQDGEAVCTIGGTTLGLIPSTHVTVPSNVTHSISNTSERPLVVMSFWWRRS